jgi:hypothetical protein
MDYLLMKDMKNIRTYLKPDPSQESPRMTLCSLDVYSCNQYNMHVPIHHKLSAALVLFLIGYRRFITG